MAKGSGLKKKVAVSGALAEFLGVDEITRSDLMKKIWAYIKKHDLQDERDKRTIVPDEELATVLGKRPINMFKMTGKLNEYLG